MELTGNYDCFVVMAFIAVTLILVLGAWYELERSDDPKRYRDLKAEKRAVREARRAMQPPAVSGNFWRGVTSAVVFMLTFIAIGLAIFWTSEAICLDGTCPGYACTDNIECGACSCAKRDGQPFGDCR